jgi:uncharacterized protein (DUF58 family)
MLLGGMAASGVFGKRNLSRVEVDVQFPREIYANRDFTVQVRLSNRRRYLPVFLMRTKIGAKEALFPFVDKKSQGHAHLPFSFPRRGLHRIDAVYVESRFPFNFFVRAAKLDKPIEVLVFPEPVKYNEVLQRNQERGAKGESHAGQRGDGSELVAIRDYLPGDPRKYINWKASAKTGALKTTEFEALSQQPVIIDFDRVDIRNVEEKLSAIAFMVLRLLKKNVPVGLRMGNVFHRPSVSEAHKVSIMKELALYDR